MTNLPQVDNLKVALVMSAGIVLLMSTVMMSSILSIMPVHAQIVTGPSAFCHVTDGKFTVCPDGSKEWSDVQLAHFEETKTFLYADQADLDHSVGSPNKAEETFMLMYDECGRTVPLGPDEYVLVRFMTVDVDDGKEKVEQYVLHLFTDGTIVFIEDGEIEGTGRSEMIEGQRGIVGFGPSPNCPFDHVISEFQVFLTPEGGAYSPDPLWWTSSVTDPNCSVDIVGNPSSMTYNPGQQAQLNAVVSGAVPLSYSWAVEGNILKDYDDSVYVALVTSTVMPPTPMAQSDFQNPSISFYWKPATDPIRTVAVRVQTANGICEDREDYTVVMGTTATTQAEDYYASTNHPVSGTTVTLQQHNQWHADYRFNDASYNNNGDLFFDFHELYLAHFDAWRAEFGYPPIAIWNPGTALPVGVDINHSPRAASYTPLSLYTWFQAQPAGDGPNNRPSNGFPCESADAPVSPWPSVQDALNDFPPDQELLGCALTHPYHNLRHVAIGGDMSFTDTAPRDPIFWRYHTFIDSVSDARDGLTPPRVTHQHPFRLYQFITELPTISANESAFGKVGAQAISVYFSEPVANVNANDLTVNGSPAMRVVGNGAGPYVFTGFKSPEIGAIKVVLASGKIMDVEKNQFGGDSWQYVLVDPKKDADSDGIIDGYEVNVLRINPTKSDTDGDGMPDGYEASTSCLNPLVDDTHVMDMAGNIIVGSIPDSDGDGVPNVEEYKLKTDPCPAPSEEPKGDFDDDGVPNEIDNCRLVSNKDQTDRNFNGIGDACERKDFVHGTSAFLQAFGDGSTLVEPRSLKPSGDPKISEIITRIVEFRLDSGLASSQSKLTENLVDGFVDLDLVSSADSGKLVKTVLEEVGETTKIGGTEFSVRHSINGGKVLGIAPSVESKSLLISLETTSDGALTITLPRSLIDAKIDGRDESFAVLVNDKKADVEEEAAPSHRTLTIPFSEGDKKIEIIGTFVVPEFGVMTTLILALSVMSLIAVFTKSKLIRK